ncbi:MAG: hypothetical protein DI539_29155 [Flavobacterium psychrophilum]|jgi:hypothetical protein|nr:MAG: hypothetical protein DI539_29155 [Flavobacterium psychrophilum]
MVGKQLKRKVSHAGATIETVYSYTCSAPIVAGEFFSAVLKQEVTFKGKPRVTLEEIGVFRVKNDKIIKERSFIE